MPDEQFADITFPRSGIDVSMGYGQQRTGTTPAGLNVRTFEPLTNRARGASRPGLSKYFPLQVSGSKALVQELAALIDISTVPGGGSVQPNVAGRVVNIVAVSGGNVFVTQPGVPTWSSPTNNTGNTTPLLTTGVVRSAPNNQKLYFADGQNYCYFDPNTNQVNPWVATAGTLPRDKSNNAPRLICTWRGRTVLSGLLFDPQNWFMSAVSDPTNWDTNPFAPSPAQAIFGNNSPLGLIGDVVTTMIPWRDDVLIMGGDHTIWQFSGDPMNGGTIDLVSDSIGMAWGIPWAKGPDGTVYFVSNRTGIYALVPGQGFPQRISQSIEQLLVPINTGTSIIRLAWNDRFQGLDLFVSNGSASASATHYFWEQRSGAWWQVAFTNNDQNPLCLCVCDGNNPGDRTVLIGSWDGYVRAIDPTATNDDGYPIQSAVIIGPLLTPQFDDMLLKDIQAVLGAASGQVQYQVFVGSTAEIALSTPSVSSGTWTTAGRNLTNYIRRSGHAVWIQLSSSQPWALEGIRARIATQGKVRRRGI